MSISSLHKTGYGNTQNIQENIIPEGAYLQKYDFKTERAAQTVMRITGGPFSGASLSRENLFTEPDLLVVRVNAGGGQAA